MSTIDGKDAKSRKAIPLATGCLDYFPDALIAVAELSRIGNDQHNPGQPLHWSREKSCDHPDCLLRHFVDRGKRDVDGVLHSAKAAWRALAILQLEIEAEYGAAVVMTITAERHEDVPDPVGKPIEGKLKIGDFVRSIEDGTIGEIITFGNGGAVEVDQGGDAEILVKWNGVEGVHWTSRSQIERGTPEPMRLVPREAVVAGHDHRDPGDEG